MNLDATSLLRVGACIVGIVTIKSAIPGVIGGLAWLRVSGYLYNPQSVFITKLTLATNTVLLTFGLFLLFGNAVVAKILRDPAQQAADV